MHSKEALIDIHKRTHRGLACLVAHCEEMDSRVLSREIEGFGYPTILQQLHHAYGAEKYWVSVLQNNTDADEDDSDWANLENLHAFGESITAETSRYLSETSDESLNTPADLKIWNGDSKIYVPAQVILRTQTHIFHHQGQISAMCRLSGSPVPSGFDYSID